MSAVKRNISKTDDGGGKGLKDKDGKPMKFNSFGEPLIQEEGAGFESEPDSATPKNEK